MSTSDYRDDSLNLAETNERVQKTVKPSKTACVLSGLLVGAATGAIIGGVFTLRTGEMTGIIIGAIVGPLLGLIAGSRIASLGSVFEGAALGGFLPVGLCLIDAIRRNRIKDIRVQDFQDPRFLAVAAGAIGTGALLGGLLVATRKWIERGLGR